MEETIQILEKINWFLRPIADAAMYLFTTTSGKIILGICLFLYIIISTSNAVKVRRLFHSSGSSFGRGSLPFFEKAYIILREIGRIIGNLVTKIPVLLVVFLLLFFIVAFSSKIQSFENILQNQQRIKELRTVVKHLDQSYKVAELKVIDQTTDPETKETKTKIEVQYFDYAGLGISETPQMITFPGKIVYFDAIILNFEYSEIASGTHKNLTIPYKIHSEELSQANGIKLKITDKKGIPYFFHRPEDKIWGISPDEYDQRLVDLVSFIKDEDKAREAGVRNVAGTGEAVSVRLWPNSPVYEVWVEQTGGLVLKKQSF